MTVLVSSHNLSEMEGICDSIGIISKGRMHLEKELDAMKSKMNKVQVSFGTSGCPDSVLQNLHILHQESKGSVELLIIHEKAARIRAVSYTHLDVYKRQGKPDEEGSCKMGE